MKTFRFFFVALAAIALFTACSSEEVIQPINNEGQPISFRLQGGTPEITTRSTATTLPYLDAFVVYGTDDVYGATNDLIFDGTTVALDINSGSFTYAPTRYYDLGAGAASFVAFSPVSAKVSNINATSFWTAGTSFDYTVPAPDNSGNTVQEDLLVASVAITSITPSVSIPFEHALARIFVTATNAANDPVFIDSLILRNLQTTGTLAFAPHPATTRTWTPAGTLGDYKYILAPSGVVVDSLTNTPTLVTSMEQGMMVLPQATQNTNNDHVFDSGDFALQVYYRFSNLGAQSRYIMLTNNYAFAEGNQYTINLDFAGGTAIDFTVTVDTFAPLTAAPPAP